MNVEITTLDDVRKMVAMLSAEFGVPTPTLKMDPCDWRGLEMATLHEFTHAVRFHRVGHHLHDRQFFEVLFDVARVWLGDPTRYEWQNEYQTIWRLAFRSGLTCLVRNEAARSRRCKQRLLVVNSEI